MGGFRKKRRRKREEGFGGFISLPIRKSFSFRGTQKIYSKRVLRGLEGFI